MNLPESLLLLAVALIGCSATSEPQAPQMQMHRTQAGSLDSTGWTAAKSTEGAFEVRLPCKFNDYTADAGEKDGKKALLYAVGCDRSDHVRFFAARSEYLNGRDGAEAKFAELSRNGLMPGMPVKRGQHMGAPYVDTVISQGSKCAWSRFLRAGSENLLMIVEPINVPCTDQSAAAQKFFDSAVVGLK
jgi:hypothetical protein